MSYNENEDYFIKITEARRWAWEYFTYGAVLGGLCSGLSILLYLSYPISATN